MVLVSKHNNRRVGVSNCQYYYFARFVFGSWDGVRQRTGIAFLFVVWPWFIQYLLLADDNDGSVDISVDNSYGDGDGDNGVDDDELLIIERMDRERKWNSLK